MIWRKSNMINIKPRTYNEILRLTRCMAMKNYIPDLTDEKIEEMYNFLTQNPQNRISLTSEMLSYVNAAGETESATVIDAPTGTFSFDRIILGATTFNVLNNRRTSDSSGCSGCSGCSSNNNNNNNNNNNG